tara:strand:- start:128 stop:238 length:111 start_codon:yes stop_codon:yes gene_type:complete
MTNTPKLQKHNVLRNRAHKGAERSGAALGDPCLRAC